MRLDGIGQLSDLSDSRLHYRSDSCQERSLLPHIASSFAELKLGHTVVANFFPHGSGVAKVALLLEAVVSGAVTSSMRRAPARPVRACFVRSCCSVVVQEHDPCATPVQCKAKRRLSSHFTLHSSHFTLALHTPHFISSHLISSLLTSSHLFSPHLTSSQLFSSHPISSHMPSN